jgi:hypothetical protein
MPRSPVGLLAAVPTVMSVIAGFSPAAITAIGTVYVAEGKPS